MTARRVVPLALGVALLLGGCASAEPEDEIELTLPTQSEADSAATQRIHKQNADAEMQKLEAEIAGDKQP